MSVKKTLLSPTSIGKILKALVRQSFLLTLELNKTTPVETPQEKKDYWRQGLKKKQSRSTQRAEIQQI